MKNENILISGAGIAGTSVAFWLSKYGFKPVIVEKSPVFRTGGYIIDFFGVGFEVAEKMNIVDALRNEDIQMNEVTAVNKDGKRISGLNMYQFRKALGGRVFSLKRSSLAKTIYDALPKGIEIIYNNSIKSLKDENGAVAVEFEDGTIRNFDLVIGADGLHSKVRELAFGPEDKFEKFFGYYVSSFTMPDKLTVNKNFLSYSLPGKQANLYTLNDGRQAALLIYRSNNKLKYNHHNVKEQMQLLRNEYAHEGWLCQQMLDEMEKTEDFYFDAVSQIKMDTWSRGRISLVGDACDCPSLLSGQGSTLAMAASYILAGELKKHNGDHTIAFSEYERKFKPFIDNKQNLAQGFAASFVPSSALSIWLRNMALRLSGFSFFAKWMAGKFMVDDIVLDEY
jgi:2-polyprenyl-6-methoxyphenol hydroxylase-like FAD-dependent oxidoreductase